MTSPECRETWQCPRCRQVIGEEWEHRSVEEGCLPAKLEVFVRDGKPFGRVVFGEVVPLLRR